MEPARSTLANVALLAAREGVTEEATREGVREGEEAGCCCAASLSLIVQCDASGEACEW